ncbi:hypothetical protein FKM82_024572 [Ascaphus truei]
MKVLSVSCCRVSISALLEPHPCVHRKYQHPGFEVLFGVLRSAMLAELKTGLLQRCVFSWSVSPGSLKNTALSLQRSALIQS